MVRRNLILGGMTLCLVVATGTCVQAGLFGKEETPGERFRKAIERETQYCATHTIKPNNRRCDITKLQPADPLATEEGRFAHSIKIPNPVPEDSGYKPGMTSKEYFDHLCKTEAGEFIYKTVENVDGVYMMRPRERYLMTIWNTFMRLKILTDIRTGKQEILRPFLLILHGGFILILRRLFLHQSCPKFRMHVIVVMPAMCRINPDG